MRWFAHRVQRPNEKVNHALILGGAPGIGKDTMLEPLKYAVGPWNFAEVSPQQVAGQFNGFLKSVVIRISEARDVGDVDRYKAYDHMKSYTAAPPDVLRVDEKNLREHSVPNVCGIVITTNYQDALYLPADDRRHLVPGLICPKQTFPTITGTISGLGSMVAATPTSRLIFMNSTSPNLTRRLPLRRPTLFGSPSRRDVRQDAELADALDRLDNPDAVTIEQVADVADLHFHDWLLDRRNRRVIAHRFEVAGYARVINDLLNERYGSSTASDKSSTPSRNYLSGIGSRQPER